MLNKEELLGGRYRIKSLIGDGGMANVYLAFDEILEREVAVKVLRYQLANDAVFVRRFEREAQSVTALNHPNIVNVYDVGSEGDTHYIVMEYVSGNTLKQMIQTRGHLTVSETTEIMQQILAAVEQAHEFGIVHRDLKPQNIIVRPDGVVKVMDFGIALTQEATSLTQTHSVMGSVQYLSPEQVRGEIATNQSDLYELGIVLYEMLTGELPFEGESAVNIVLKHLKDALPDIQAKNPQVPNSLVNVINRATAKEKSQRYPNAQTMAMDLATVLDEARLNEAILPVTAWLDTDVSQVVEELEATREIPVMVRKKATPTESVEATTEIVRESATKKRDDEPKVTEVKPKKKKRIVPIVIGAVVVVLIASLAVFAMMQPKKVEIPNVVNMTIDQAKQMLEAEGLLVSQQINYEFNDAIDKNKVIITDPKPGTSVEENTTITLTVSEGVEVYMPYVVGKVVEDAVAALDKLQIRSQVVQEFSDQPEGVVLSQSLEKDVRVDIDSQTVLLTVSKGMAPIYMEDFTGFTKEAVERFATENGLKITIKETETSASPVGTVLEQFPAAGVKLSPGDTISISIAKKPSSILDALFPPKEEETTPPTDGGTTGDTTGGTGDTNGGTTGGDTTGGTTEETTPPTDTQSETPTP